jgi:hypothetical protein
MDYEKLMLKIKNEKFPELKDIDVKVKPMPKIFTKVVNSKIFRKFNLTPLMSIVLGKHIYYNDGLIKKMKYNNKIIISIFAHELSHAIQNKKEKKKNQFQNILNITIKSIKYYFIVSYRSKHEKEADRIAIKKGFGKGLIMFREWKNKKTRNKKSVYYTAEELKKLVYKK